MDESYGRLGLRDRTLWYEDRGSLATKRTRKVRLIVTGKQIQIPGTFATKAKHQIPRVEKSTKTILHSPRRNEHHVLVVNRYLKSFQDQRSKRESD